MSDHRPIGVFDSGLGGLTVVRELMRLMPDEQVIYLGDCARCPYGGRSNETIRRFALEDASFLYERGVKMLIVACNTVSSVALDLLSDTFPEVPVIGVVLPGARAATLRTAEKRIGVIGTQATIRAGSYPKAIRELDEHIVVHGRACPLLVPFVEEGMVDGTLTRQVVQHYLYELVDTGIDTLILGCTHYPLLMGIIQETVGTRIQLIDSAYWTAREARDILLNCAAGAEPDGKEGGSVFVFSDLVPSLEERAARFLGRSPDTVETVTLDELARGAVRSTAV